MSKAAGIKAQPQSELIYKGALTEILAWFDIHDPRRKPSPSDLEAIKSFEPLPSTDRWKRGPYEIAKSAEQGRAQPVFELWGLEGSKAAVEKAVETGVGALHAQTFDPFDLPKSLPQGHRIIGGLGDGVLIRRPDGTTYKVEDLEELASLVEEEYSGRLAAIVRFIESKDPDDGPKRGAIAQHFSRHGSDKPYERFPYRIQRVKPHTQKPHLYRLVRYSDIEQFRKACERNS
ncbi:MAG: hypothetical protein AB4050_01760 [Synechococcus sp.]